MPNKPFAVGSAKDIYVSSTTGSTTPLLDFVFTDRVSVFDIGPIPVPFSGLGTPRYKFFRKSYTELAGQGFSNHVVQFHTDNRVTVQAFDIPEKNIKFSESSGRLIPLEILHRYEIPKKHVPRIKAEETSIAKIEKLIANGQVLEAGTRLSHPLLECSTKHQDADTYVSDVQAAKLAGITLDELEQLYTEARKVAEYLKNRFRSIGFDMKAGKTEWARLHSGKFILVDSVSPDELTLVGQDGLSYDKDLVRQWYETEHPEWVAKVSQAKKAHPNDKSKWPTYEAVPPTEIIQEVVRRYRAVADALGCC